MRFLALKIKSLEGFRTLISQDCKTTNLGVEDGGLKEPSASQKKGWRARTRSFLRAGHVGAEEAADAPGEVKRQATYQHLLGRMLVDGQPIGTFKTMLLVPPSSPQADGNEEPDWG